MVLSHAVCRRVLADSGDVDLLVVHEEVLYDGLHPRDRREWRAGRVYGRYSLIGANYSVFSGFFDVIS